MATPSPQSNAIVNATPSVSVIIPTLNERRYIRDLLDALMAQDYEHICEILIVDGQSTDGTVDIIHASGCGIEVVPNPGVTAAAAMNVGIDRAKGDVIVRLDAHARYAPDYVSRCVDVLVETGADNVGGPMRPQGTTAFGRAVAAVTTSRYGIGPGTFHYGTERCEVDTVFLGCWPKSVLERLGGFDEVNLQWAAEDHELNMRLTQSGGKIILDPNIRSVYFPRSTPEALARQYFNYGVGKASTLAKHRMLPSWRPLVPAAMVAVTLVAAITGRGASRVAVPVVHSVFVGTLGQKLARTDGVTAHHAAQATSICHWTYGAGFWVGIGRWLTGRGFDNRRKTGCR